MFGIFEYSQTNRTQLITYQFMIFNWNNDPDDKICRFIHHNTLLNFKYVSLSRRMKQKELKISDYSVLGS